MEQDDNGGQPEPLTSVAESPEPGAGADDGAAPDGAAGPEGAAPDAGAGPERAATSDGDGQQGEQPVAAVPDDTRAENSTVDAGWSGVELVVVALVAVIGAAIGYTAARLTKRRAGASHRADPVPEAPPVTPPAAPPSMVVVDEHRDGLVGALIDARDRVGESGVGDRIVVALRDAGVEVIDPTGDRFDPEQHVAAGHDRLTDDPALDGRVADVVSYGYRDRGRVLRLPSVVVWRARYGSEAVRSEVLR